MHPCDTCGNVYDKAFQIVTNGGDEFWFDSFECAIQRLAPTCTHCGCRMIGHGVEAADGALYCCANCAHHAGVEGLEDRQSVPTPRGRSAGASVVPLRHV